MELSAYLRAIRRGWLLILLATILGAGVSWVAYALTPKEYSSSVDFYVSTPQTEGTSAQSGGQFAQSRVNSYILLLSSEQLARRVIASTGVDLGPRDLGAEVTATAELSTVVVTATVTDRSASRSLQIAQGLADNFNLLVDELDNQGKKANAIVVIHVVSGPTLHAGHVSPIWNRYLGLGLAAGLLLGLVIAVLRELLDTSVRDVEATQRLTGAPVLGSILFDSDTRKSPLIVGEEATTVRAEAYRQLRTNLQFISAARSADVLLITSSLPREGKTTTAVNLALTFAQFGESVLLIEGDLRRPKVADYLGLERGVGLSNVLAGQVKLDDVIQSWGSGGLSFLASGSTPPNPSELLGSAQMVETIKVLRTRFDKIVIDTPPILPVTDAAVASSWADAVVLVIRHGHSHRTQVAAAARALHNVEGHLIGCVFNMRKSSRAERRIYGTDEYYSVDTESVTQPARGSREDPLSQRAARTLDPSLAKRPETKVGK